jgi:hypothetical protein
VTIAGRLAGALNGSPMRIIANEQDGVLLSISPSLRALRALRTTRRAIGGLPRVGVSAHRATIPVRVKVGAFTVARFDA